MKISLLIILFLTVTSCSNLDKRNPSSPQWNERAISLHNLKSVHDENVKHTIRNTFKIILDSTYKTKEEKINAIKTAKAYLYDSTKKIISNEAISKIGETSKYEDVLNPPRWTLKDEVKWIEAKLLESNPNAFDYDTGKYLRAISTVSSPLFEVARQNDISIHQDVEELYTILKQSEDDTQMGLEYIRKFEVSLDPYLERFKKIGTEIAASGEVDFGNPEAEKFFVKFLDYYYSNVDISVVKNIINDLADLGNPNPDKMDVVKVMFKNSGPGLGKTLQQLGKDPEMGKSLAEVIEVLEDEGKPVPLYLVENIVNADTGGFKISNISRDPLGTGTMAQVNKAILTQGRKKTSVALRFLKPGIEARVTDDLTLLKSFIEQMATDGELDADFLPSARKLVESIATFLESELDIVSAIKKQDIGRNVYESNIDTKVNGEKYKIKIKVPGVYYPTGKKKTKLHIQEFIDFGEKFSNMKERNTQKAVAIAIMEAWFREALIKSGFIHSDLHQGNFTVKNITKDSAEVVLFDFGMSETLTTKTRQSFILIGSGVEFKKPALIADGILLMDDEYTKSKRKKLLKLVEAEIHSIETTQEWIVWALKQGYLKNDQLGTLARGGHLVSQLGKIIGEEDLHEEVVERLLSKNVIKAFKGDKNFPLTRSQVLKIGTSNCFYSIKSFFNRSNK